MSNQPRLSALPPVPRHSLGDRVYETLRDRIVSLQLEPGEMVYENELSDMLQVSRTPVREAIRLLVSEELMEVLPQRGTRIARISGRKVSEARYVRELLEVGSFRLAARRWGKIGTPEIEKKLTDLLAGQKEAASRRDFVRFIALDEAFHRRIMEATGNATLVKVVDQMRAHINRLRCLALRELRVSDRVLSEHEQLLLALRRCDERMIVDVLERHLRALENEIPDLRKRLPHYFADDPEESS